MKPTPVSFLRGQNYFQLLVTGGIYINPKLLQFLLALLPAPSGLVKCHGCPETKNSDTSFSSPPPNPQSQTVSVCCD